MRFYEYLVNKDPKLAVQVESVYNATKETINSISGCYNNYTMHDIGHSLRVASYMEVLSCGIDNFEENLQEFNAFEVALMLLSSLLHDIGMFIRPEDREKIKRNEIAYTNSLTFAGVLNVVDGSEDEAIKEIVRITHAQRINEYIDFDFNGKTISSILQLDDKYGYSDDVVSISVAHGENYDYLNGLRTRCTKGNYTYNPQYIAALLRIADYLDLDKQRTPILWYKMMRIDGFSKEEWEKHFVVHNEMKFKNYIGDKLQIYFEGRSSNAKIHRKYLAYVDELRTELERADELLNHKTAEKKYLFRISPKVEDCVVTEGFKYSDLRLNLDYSSITELLMGNNIYGDKRLGLRELIQNALDACKLMKELQEKSGEDEEFTPQITILISEEKGYVKIKDTGIGMTIDVVKKHFLNVGKSYYKSNEFIYSSYDYKPIGQFGIGFLACFLLSDNVTVKTKFYKSNEIHQIELEKNSEYVVTNTEETGSFWGTEITLDYGKFFDVFSGMDELINFVQKYFYTDIPITIKNVDERTEVAKGVSRACDLIAKIDVDSSGEKYEDIVCSSYSTKIEGIIRVRELKQKTNFVVQPIQNGQIYVFDKETSKFKLIADKDELPIGHYRMVAYSQIKNDEYQRISASRRKSKSKRDAILALSDQIKLLFADDTDISYLSGPHDRFQITLNNVSIKDLVTDIGLPYYDELVDDFDYYIPIFVHGSNYVLLHENPLYGKRYWFSDGDRENFMFYNKGILVKDFFGFSCWLPVAFKLRAVINYISDGIKLDVSRNSIISNRKIIQHEVEAIILKYILEKETANDRMELITAMINNMCG